MKFKSISITLGATINLGNYENTRRDVTVAVELEEGDLLPEVRANLLHQAHTLMAQSLINELHERFSTKNVRHDLDDRSELRGRLNDNPIFKAIASHSTTIADQLTDELWAEYMGYRDERLRLKEQREAAIEAQRQERETVMAIAQLAGVEVVANDDDDPDKGEVPEPDFDTDDDEDTAEADYDLSDPNDEDEEDDLEDPDDTGGIPGAGERVGASEY